MKKFMQAGSFQIRQARVAEVEGNRYEILNPSIKNGSVRLLYYIEDTSQIQIPAQVRIGDYYYFIERVAPRAFAIVEKCAHLRSQIVFGCWKKKHSLGADD